MGAGDGAQALSDGFGNGNHLDGLLCRQVRFAMAMPQPEPGLKMRFFKTQGDVARGHASAIKRRSSGKPRPEPGDFLQVRGPVLDVRGEDRSDLMVLAHVGVKPAQQEVKPVVATNAFVERGGRSHGKTGAWGI